MAKSKRPARRWFGRPTEGPGPQETFEGQFQVDMPQAPPANTSHQGLGLALPAATQSTPSVHRSISAPVRGRRGRGTSPALRVTVAFRSSPLLSRTRSHPTVSTQHAAMGTFNRSHSSAMLASDMRAGGSTSAGEPSSWPGPVHQAHNTDFHSAADSHFAVSPVSNRGLLPQVHTPSTPGYPRGQYSGSPPVWSAVNTPSSGSVSLLSPPDFSYSRYRSHDLPESSPTDMPSPGWQYPSPSPTSMRGASIPPSVQSEPSPRMDWLADSFSPAIGPVDGRELPPLTPDMIDFSEELMWHQMGSTAQPQSTAVPVSLPAPGQPSPMPFGAGRHYPQTSTSVPDDIWNFSVQDSLIESSQPVFTYASDTHTPYEHEHHDPRYPPPPRAQASTHAVSLLQQQRQASGLSVPHAGHLYPQAQASTSTHRQRSYSASAYGHVYQHPHPHPHQADPRSGLNWPP
ncbi:hypothetical protein C8Q80DRAFT_1273821 [Daedaleopsis nitida]|nr:hypothetical protein C8Q80DRAFT_1273821 [Daedaleopsis nitida]